MLTTEEIATVLGAAFALVLLIAVLAPFIHRALR